MINLPPESRCVCKYSDFGFWNWDREIQSQILHTLDVIMVNFVNANLPKGKSKAKAMDQAQPDNVKQAKERLKAQKTLAMDDEEKETLRRFFEARNADVKKLEELTDDA